MFSQIITSFAISAFNDLYFLKFNKGLFFAPKVFILCKKSIWPRGLGTMNFDSVAIMQVFRLYCNYAGGSFYYSYVGGSFCCNHACHCFCCSHSVITVCSTYVSGSLCIDYVGDNFYCIYAGGSLCCNYAGGTFCSAKLL